MPYASPRRTLLDVARALAEARADHRWWIGDTWWRAEGTLPSGDRFVLWLMCEV